METRLIIQCIAWIIIYVTGGLLLGHNKVNYQVIYFSGAILGFMLATILKNI